ncbi:MAG: aldehyde ferredoxin oxidoreductase family protein [Candidatus Jordarchaeaceae archaeon]
MSQFLPSNVLYVDLSKHLYRVRNRQELFEKYIGGTGVATQLLLEECEKGADPLGPGNVIVFAVGPLTNIYPMASKTVAMFKSPHTGNLGESHAGGRSAIAIRSAGYGAIVIKGVSESPVYLAIHEDRVFFRDATAYWGMNSAQTVGRVIRENEPGSGNRTIMRIGKAGEKLVTYANLVTETYRHFGRLGLGAVFGSKRLKAVLVSGRKTTPVADRKLFKEVYETLYNQQTKSSALQKYHDLGTASNILVLNELKGLPTRNLEQAWFEGAEEISGENLAEKYLGRRVACAHCPVACIHLATLREPYEDEPYFYKTTMVPYDYELLYALGCMLGVSSVNGVLKLIDEVENWGLDAISTGVILAWATEAVQKELVTKEETLGLEPKWGDYKTYLKMIELIVEQPNQFYKHLAKGVERAAEKYGGAEFALAMGGNEPAGYHTGPAGYAGFYTGARHSHLDSAGYGIDQKAVGKTQELTAQKIADGLIKEEAWRQILSSLVVCFFARGVYTPEIVTKALKTVDLNFTENQLMETGLEILKEKYRFKFREGFEFKNLRIPQRILETESPHKNIQKEIIEQAIDLYAQKIKT